MSYLVLAHSHDATATRVAAALTARHGVRNVCLVYDSELTGGAVWSHTVSVEGSSFRLTLRSGEQFKDSDISAICNRLRYSFVPHFAQADAVDREYAAMETFALMLSWLESLAPRVVNRVSPQSLTGSAPDPLLWQALAARVGLPVARSLASSSLRRYTGKLTTSPAAKCASYAYALPGANPAMPAGPRPGWIHEPLSCYRDKLTVIGDRVFGKLPRELHVGARQLAQILGCAVLGVQFVQTSDGRWCFEEFDSCPDLVDTQEIDALVGLLEALPQRCCAPEL